MLLISKSDALYMRSKGFEELVKSSSNKRHKHYYLVEEPDSWYWDRKLHKKIITRVGALSFYKKYKSSRILETKTK